MAEFSDVAKKAIDTGAKVYATYKTGKAAIGKIKSAIHKGRNTIRKVKKVANHVKHGYEIGKAGVKLVARVANPKNQAKFIKDAAKGKGFVLPGSKYIGPGNSMDKGEPVDEADANAYQHDVDYDNYIKSGKVSKKNVYLGYSDADERLLKKTKANTPSGLAVNIGMGAKKLLNKTGLTKRIRDKDVYGDSGPPQQNAKPPPQLIPKPRPRPLQSDVQTRPIY